MRLTMVDDELLKDGVIKDEDIANIVYSDVEDDNQEGKYALVFGNSMLIKERVGKAVEIYQSGRAEKFIFMGGANGVSNQDGSTVAEADKMKALAIELGIPEDNILVDNQSNNTFENIDNALNLIGDEISIIDNVLVITSEFHLKRCYAALKLRCPNLNVSLVAAKDGFTDSDNWFLSDGSWNTGRAIATFEARVLVKYAKEGKISDIEVPIHSYAK